MEAAKKPLGFWACWALVVGTMIGSGILMLPTLLAPYGLVGLAGLLLAGAGAILLALTFARRAAQTDESGGPYVYVRNTFGDLAGFVVGWSHWCSYTIAIPVVAIAFVGYLTTFAPALEASPVGQASAALAIIWLITLINMRGLREASAAQIVMTLLKIAPLLGIVALAGFQGAPANLPAPDPTGAPLIVTMSAVALITLWPFTGFETGTLPAGDVHNCRRNIPRALIIGMITVTAIYFAATFAVMMLVPADALALSTAPFADAARGFGAWGPPLVAAGALAATAGTLNGIVFTCGQLPMAVARDKFAPAALAAINRGGSPYAALVLSSTIGSLLLITNYSRGLIGAFTFLLMMSTATTLLPYFMTALAELRQSWRDARAWAVVAILAAAYALFALFGSGLEVLGWGLLLTIAGVPLFYFMRGGSSGRAPVSPAS